MDIQDFSHLIGRIWDPKVGGFDRKYYTEARITAIFDGFKSDPTDLFANVVDTIIKKFRTTPTVEQFQAVGREIRAYRRERQAAVEKKEFQKGQEALGTSFKEYVEGLLKDKSRVDELDDLLRIYGLARIEKTLGYTIGLVSP